VNSSSFLRFVRRRRRLHSAAAIFDIFFFFLLFIRIRTIHTLSSATSLCYNNARRIRSLLLRIHHTRVRTTRRASFLLFLWHSWNSTAGDSNNSNNNNISVRARARVFLCTVHEYYLIYVHLSRRAASLHVYISPSSSSSSSYRTDRYRRVCRIIMRL